MQKVDRLSCTYIVHKAILYHTPIASLTIHNSARFSFASGNSLG
ncbi:MAG: hypothetical protein RLZZ367_1963 [Bacteroidota bacterium]|jgi:hypothetical protein